MTSSPEQIRGACGHDCPDTCAWVVTVEQGRATALAGDRDHPFTRGTLCAKVNHYLDRVYHPDRVLHPLRRTGPKGSGQFERVTWDEALADIAGRWQAVIAEHGAEAILPYSSAGMQGLVQQASLDMRLFGALGASRLDRNICGAVASAGMKATLGVGSGIDPEEVAHARLIVLWGTNTVITNLHYWPLVKAAAAFLNESEQPTLGAGQGFGHIGYNGSGAWCDPARGLAFAYVQTYPSAGLTGDPRLWWLSQRALWLADRA